MDKQEFLNTLKNPIRTRINKQIASFFASTQYYAWDIVAHTKHIEKDGCHDLYISLTNADYFIQVERSLREYFPHSQDYSVVTTSSSPRKDFVAPDGDIAYTKCYAVVEAANYELHNLKGYFYCPYIPTFFTKPTEPWPENE